MYLDGDGGGGGGGVLECRPEQKKVAKMVQRFLQGENGRPELGIHM